MGLRILVVVSSNARRGAEVEGTQLTAELCRAGHEADVVALSPSPDAGLDVECLGDSRLAVSTLRRLRSRARACDVVVAYGSSALPACAIALLGSRVPFVYRSIGDPARWVRGGLHRRRTGLLFRRARRVVALWSAAGESIERLYRVPAGRIVSIPNARPGVTPAPFDQRAGARERLGLAATGDVVAFVGALSPEKRPLLAIDAVAAVPGAHLLLVGAGPLAAQVQDACELRLAGRYTRMGVVAPLDDVWAAADVALLTSATEGMPGVLIEAQLAGVPVVSSAVGAVDLVVADGASGVLVPPDGDATSYAAALATVFAERDRMGLSARAHAARFTWGAVLPLWIELLSRCTARASAPPTDRG